MNSKEMIASEPEYQEFEPAVEWINEESCDTLLLYLPGFSKEQLRVQLRSRTLIISGERNLHHNTWSRFRKEFLVSEHCEVNKISAKFEGNILFVKQPKSITPAVKHEENPQINAPAPMPKNPTNEQKVDQKKALVKPDSEPTGNNGVDDNTNNGPEKDVEAGKDGKSEGLIRELKEENTVVESAWKKKASGLDFVTKLKPSRNDVIKVLILVVGFVLGVYCSSSIKSRIA